MFCRNAAYFCLHAAAKISALVRCKRLHPNGMARTKQSARMSAYGGVHRIRPERVTDDPTSGSGPGDREAKRSRPATDQAIGTSSTLQQVLPIPELCSRSASVSASACCHRSGLAARPCCRSDQVAW